MRIRSVILGLLAGLAACGCEDDYVTRNVFDRVTLYGKATGAYLDAEGDLDCEVICLDNGRWQSRRYESSSNGAFLEDCEITHVHIDETDECAEQNSLAVCLQIFADCHGVYIEEGCPQW